MRKGKQSTLKFGGWNIDGLHKRVNRKRINKLNQEDTFDKIKDMDIVLLIETHCSYKDTYQVPGYTVHNQIRPKSPGSKKHYGGISVLIKDTIRHGITYLPSNNSEFLWLKLCRTFFSLPYDLYVLAVYICPENSTFSGKTGNLFQLIETDIAKYSKLGKCLAFGDFNGRTSVDPDYCVDDDVLSMFVPDDGSNRIDCPIDRNNCDLNPADNNGKSLLNLCKSSGLRIINGRVLGDSLGYHTCFSKNGNPSTIDYFLASPEILDNTRYMRVEDPCVDSIHCLLNLCINTSSFNTINPQDDSCKLEEIPNYRWDKFAALRFQESVAKLAPTFKVPDILTDPSPENIDAEVSKLSSFLQYCASEAKIRCKGRKLSHSNDKTKKRNKIWFSTELLNLKKEIKQLACALRTTPNDKAKLAHFHSKKSIYKKMVKRIKRQHEQSIINKLTSLEKADPQKFWHLFNQLKDLDRAHKSNPITPSEWVSHFENLLNIQPNIENSLKQRVDRMLNSNACNLFNELNFKITLKELSQAASLLKKGKSSGTDGITNEMILSSFPYLNLYYLRIFNLIFVNSTFPKSWNINTLTPLHKKGSIHVRENYRGIAVSNCIAKLFLTIIHNRLSKFAASHDIIPPNQIGYRKGSRTTDHILTLKNIIDKYINAGTRKHLFACFVDFKAAFDSVWREGLFYKMLHMGIGGNLLNLLRNMYDKVMYSVKIDGKISKPFLSRVGVKQGCVLSPLLFNMFISDLPDIFTADCDPVTVNSLSTNSLLFADDLVMLSESAEGLQNCIDKLEGYCNKWGLCINQSKTKVIIFNKGGMKISKFRFCVNNQVIDVVQSYCYLGIVFSSCGSFTRAIAALQDKARKAFFALKQIDTSQHAQLTISLFDRLVLPVMTYGIEVWGPYFISKSNCASNHSVKCMLEPHSVEKLNLHLCKFVLGVSRKATNDAVRGEVGRLPILLITARRWVSFTKRAFCLPQENLLKCSLPPATDFGKNEKSSWSAHMFNMMSLCNGISYPETPLLSLFQPGFDAECFNSLSEHYKQGWLESINKVHDNTSGHKLKTYCSLKTQFGMENYVRGIPQSERRHFTKLKISAHHLSIERGRYTRPITPRSQRYCSDCKEQAIGDEFHFLLKCPKFAWERRKMFEKFSEFTSIKNNGDDDTFITLMQHLQGDIEIARIVCAFVNECF